MQITKNDSIAKVYFCKLCAVKCRRILVEFEFGIVPNSFSILCKSVVWRKWCGATYNDKVCAKTFLLPLTKRAVKWYNVVVNKLHTADFV